MPGREGNGNRSAYQSLAEYLPAVSELTSPSHHHNPPVPKGAPLVDEEEQESTYSIFTASSASIHRPPQPVALPNDSANSTGCSLMAVEVAPQQQLDNELMMKVSICSDCPDHSGGLDRPDSPDRLDRSSKSPPTSSHVPMKLMQDPFSMGSVPSSSAASSVLNAMGGEKAYRFDWVHSHLELWELVERAQEAIDDGLLPERISQGSSGSYFIKGPTRCKIGVFKPKDEEPYGNLNPKWIKWLHRTCCPCLFGRSFLMPNTGYISEAAASLVDNFLGLGVVPRTQITHLSASSFKYQLWDVWRTRQARRSDPKARYPLKLGSFQLYVEGFEQSAAVLARMHAMQPASSKLRTAFQLEFEKMVILDYAIRNTDRTFDNWLIHFSWNHQPDRNAPYGLSTLIETEAQNGQFTHQPRPQRHQSSSFFSVLQSVNPFARSTDPDANRSVDENPSLVYPTQPSSPHPHDDTSSTIHPPQSKSHPNLHTSSQPNVTLQASPSPQPVVKIACIDNGLAFPFKHPDELRSYPYSWASLPEARIPFSPHLRHSLLPLLSDTANWEALIGRLRQIFQIDADFNEHIFSRQMAVLRGQLHNIVRSLQHHESPAELIERPLLLIEEEDQPRFAEHDDLIYAYEQRHSARKRHRRRTIHNRPLFSCC